MEKCTSGYVADVSYTFVYYHEPNSIILKLAFVNAQQVHQKFFNACESVIRQGISVNVHAAASNKQWFVADFDQ